MRPSTFPVIPFLCWTLVLSKYTLSVIAVTPSFTELETLTAKEKDSLAKFKETASTLVPHDYMKEDIYLVKYMKYNNFHIKKSLEHLNDALKWRKDNKVDELLENPSEDFKAFEKDFPVYVDGFDREGRPICETHFGAWPIRKAALAGKIKQLLLYTAVNCFEKALVTARMQMSRGKNVTEWIILANLENFGVADQACVSCLPFEAGAAVAMDNYFPLTTHGVWTIKTPESFAIIARLVRPLMSPKLRSGFKVLTSNEAEWKAFLEKRVDPKEISDWYFPSGKSRNP